MPNNISYSIIIPLVLEDSEEFVAKPPFYFPLTQP
jgi:hypothetical protein